MTQRQYMLDTNVLLQLVRGGEIGTAIKDKFQLEAQILRPQLCVVTYGEIWVIAERNNWGDAKRQSLETAINALPPVDINSDEVVRAYVEIMLYSNSVGRSMEKKQNDVWIAAAAKAAGAYLLGCDGDFDHLYGQQIEGEYIDQLAILNGGKSDE